MKNAIAYTLLFLYITWMILLVLLVAKVFFPALPLTWSELVLPFLLASITLGGTTTVVCLLMRDK